MPRLPIQLGALELFAEAARRRSYKAAARHLFVSTSAVSQAVHKLEQQIGCQLIRRVGNDLEVTSEGEILLRHAERGLEEIRAGIDALQRPLPPLTLYAPPTLASQLLFTVLGELTDKGINDIHLVCDEVPDFISFSPFDVAIVYGSRAPSVPGLESLGPDVFVPACTPEVAATVKSAQDILGKLLINNDANAVQWKDWLRMNHLETERVRYMSVNRGTQMVEAMKHGLGIGLESKRVMARLLERGDLVEVGFEGLVPVSRELTFLYVCDRSPRQEHANLFAEMIRKQCRTVADGTREALVNSEYSEDRDQLSSP